MRVFAVGHNSLVRNDILRTFCRFLPHFTQKYAINSNKYTGVLISP